MSGTGWILVLIMIVVLMLLVTGKFTPIWTTVKTQFGWK